MENDTLVDPTAEVPVTPQPEELTFELFDFNKAQTRFQKLVTTWDGRVTAPAKIRRNMRSLEIDISSLQREGKLKVDETIIPIRVIDSNIKAEQPPFISYIKQSQRLAVFRCLDNVQVDDSKKQIIEKDFTNALTYNGWEKWVYRLIDGAQLHGFCCAEVEFDESKPGHVNIHTYPHEDVIYPIKSRELEFQPYILCRIAFTLYRLQDVAKRYGFDANQISIITDKYKDKDQEDDIIIYKVFIKYNGEVYVAWMDLADSCTDWLFKPVVLYLGRNKLTMTTEMQEQPMPGTMMTVPMPMQVPKWDPIREILYPIKVFKYQETEEATIVETKGRAFLDGPTQEAQTALYSSFTNAAVRASNVYASPKQNTTGSGKITRLDLTLEHGCFYSEPMEFWHTDFPTMDLIKGAQALDVRKQMESGQIAAATMAREDSRKLATELEMAKQTSDTLSSVQITNFAITLTEIFTTAWSIIQSRALQEKIPFAQVEVPDMMTGQVSYKNDLELIAYNYIIKPAGDQDVIGRAQKVQNRIQALPVFQQCLAMIAQAPAAAALIVAYISDFLREMFPEDADKYIGILNQLLMQQQQQMMMAQNMMNQSENRDLNERTTPEMVNQA